MASYLRKVARALISLNNNNNNKVKLTTWVTSSIYKYIFRIFTFQQNKNYEIIEMRNYTFD